MRSEHRTHVEMKADHTYYWWCEQDCMPENVSSGLLREVAAHAAHHEGLHSQGGPS